MLWICERLAPKKTLILRSLRSYTAHWTYWILTHAGSNNEWHLKRDHVVQCLALPWLLLATIPWLNLSLWPGLAQKHNGNLGGLWSPLYRDRASWIRMVVNLKAGSHCAKRQNSWGGHFFVVNRMASFWRCLYYVYQSHCLRTRGTLNLPGLIRYFLWPHTDLPIEAYFKGCTVRQQICRFVYFYFLYFLSSFDMCKDWINFHLLSSHPLYRVEFLIFCS